MSISKEVTIGQNKFGIIRMDAFTALGVFGDLQKELLPALGNLAADGEDSVMKTIESLSSHFTGKQLTEWAERLITPDYVSVYDKDDREFVRLTADRREIVFENAVQILELLVEIIKENFADPLTQWLGRSGLANKLKTKKTDNSAKK